jgi:hypothetical protein
MIQETELSLYVPSPELIVRLASGDKPLGVRAGPPRIRSIRETFFDTPDHVLRTRGMTCQLRQVEGEEPAVVVTVGEGPDSEGITSRSRLTAAAVGAGVFETLRGDSEAALQIQQFVVPTSLRPQIALDIQRLGRVYRGGLFLKPVLLFFFDRIMVQVGGASSVFHELSIRRRREGGPLIRDLAQQLRDEFHLFPDGLSRLERSYRLLAVEQKGAVPGLSPYGLSLALSVFSQGSLGLVERDDGLHIPTFRGSGEDAARALSSDLIGGDDLPLQRLGTTEPREGRAVAELWTVPDPSSSLDLASGGSSLTWVPWHSVLEQAGQPCLKDPTLIATLLLLTRKKLLGQLPWIEASEKAGMVESGNDPSPLSPSDPMELPVELQRVAALIPFLEAVEDKSRTLQSRLESVSKLSAELDGVFLQDVTRAKGRMLSDDPIEVETQQVQLADLLSIRIRGITDRLHGCFEKELAPELEGLGIHFRSWAGLTNPQRQAILNAFRQSHLPSMQVASEWRPSFIPDMPQAGCAIGILARQSGSNGARLFHLVLGKDSPSFLPVPGATIVLPLAEVIRGYFLTEVPELGKDQHNMFRFTTGTATIREAAAPSDLRVQDSEEAASETAADAGPPPSIPPQFVETRQSVVVRILANRNMPESDQGQLLRALEGQVGPRNTLIGWSDVFPVPGPLGLSGIEGLLELMDD